MTFSSCKGYGQRRRPRGSCARETRGVVERSNVRQIDHNITAIREPAYTEPPMTLPGMAARLY